MRFQRFFNSDGTEILCYKGSWINIDNVADVYSQACIVYIVYNSFNKIQSDIHLLPVIISFTFT